MTRPTTNVSRRSKKTLNRVGSEVQVKAWTKAASSRLIEGGDRVFEEGVKREKSKEEAQLWAMVDMMVQSKVLIKKKFGW